MFETGFRAIAHSTECMSAELSVGGTIVSVLFSLITGLSCFICSVNKRCYLLNPELICYNWCLGVR